ncbi:MAG: oligoendopeptidase F [Chloroflexi bacterium]|nr:oligoendopeptidase F [Chloroflexota bacterium]
MSTVPSRNEIPLAYTWNAYSIFPSDEAWEEAILTLETQLQTAAAYKGRLTEGPVTLAEAIDAVEQAARNASKILIYAMMFQSVDTGDQAAAAKYDRARGLLGKVQAMTAFVRPELIALGFDTLNQWRTSEPRLAHLEHYLDRLEKQQTHVRSAEVEQVLGLAQDMIGTATSVGGVLVNADLKFAAAVAADGTTHELTQGTIDALVTHNDREVRRTAFEHYADAHLAYKNTLSTSLAGAIKRDVFSARIRGYRSSLDAALTSNFIPAEVFHNLIATYKAHLPTWHRYWRLRKQALGYEQFHAYDVKAPLTQTEKHIPYEQAVEWIAAGMRPLGDDYVDVLRHGCLAGRWVDVYPNQGKRMGAFSSGSHDTNPFILMSYNDNLFSLSTLAHELGHSLHSYYSRQNQPYAYSGYGLFVAEVASNFNQALVRDHLLKTNPDPQLQIALIEEAMSNFHRYFFIMPNLARFELEMHERAERGQALTADDMINLTADLFSEGFGPDVTVDRERVGITWAQFQHLYANFYVYQYATGISGAHALAEGILADKPGSVAAYHNFLKAGGSMYPLEALKMAGADLTTPEAVETTFAVLAGYVDRLEQLLGLTIDE